MFRNKLFYLILVVTAMILAVMYNGYVTFLAALVIAGLPVFMLFFLFTAAPFVTVAARPLPLLAEKGDEITVRFIVKNSSWFPIPDAVIYLIYAHKAGRKKTAVKLHISIPAHGSAEAACSLTVPYAGSIELRAEAIRLYDYFRIFSYKKKLKKENRISEQISVLPEYKEMIVAPAAYIAEPDADEFSADKPGDDSSEIFSIREYQPGDRLHKIHWKLSMKNRNFMVKEFSLPVICSAVILFDASAMGRKKERYAHTDKILTELLSLSLALTAQKAVHDILWLDYSQNQLKRSRIRREEDIYALFGEIYAFGLGGKDVELIAELYAAVYNASKIRELFYIGLKKEENQQVLQQFGAALRTGAVYEA